MLYFAYGSNLDPEQIRERCPSSAFVCRAVLPDHRLAFTRWSVRRRCGAADVVASGGARVWGVVYDIPDPADVATLDECEGCVPGRAGNAYDRIEVDVRRERREGPCLRVWTYVVAAKLAAPQVPSRHYHGLMAGGAAHWGLPAEYVAMLNSIRSGP